MVNDPDCSNEADSLSDMGVYSVSGTAGSVAVSQFTISGTETAFIAGYGNLTWSDFKEGYDGYYYTDSSIVDAEKCTSITQDNMMCWAGTAANMLYYTGWDLDDSQSEDSVFSIFIDNFTLGDLYGGAPYYAIDWFFTGNYTPQSWSEWDRPRENSGGFYSTTFQSAKISNYLYTKSFTVSGLTAAKEKLEEGYGVGITFGYYDSSGNRNGGHVITLWGLTCDSSYSVTDPNYYTGIIVSDSDDDKRVSDPLSAPDVLKIISITYDSSLGKYIPAPDYAGKNCRLETLTFLAPNTFATPDSSKPVKIYSGEVMVKGGVSFTGEEIVREGNDSMCVSSGGNVIRTYNSGGFMEVSSGGVAHSTTITDAGVLYIYNGGKAVVTTLDDKSSMGIRSGGVGDSTTVNSGAEMYAFDGGSASNTIVNAGGRSWIAAGGWAGNVQVNDKGVFDVYGDVWTPSANDFPEPCRGGAQEVTVYSGGTANIEGGEVTDLLVSSGGIATVSGLIGVEGIDVSGIIYGGEIKSGGSLTIGQGTELYGAVFGGTIAVTGWANVYTEFCFDISERKADDTYIVDDISGLNFTEYSYCYVDMADDQADGTYKLAGNASDFNETISVEGEALTVDGNSVLIDGRYYTLSVTDSILTLTVGDTPVITGDQVQVYSSGTLVKQGTVLTGENIVSGANNSMFVYDGGTASSTTVDSYGRMYVSSGGIVKDTLLNGYLGSASVSSGGKASNTSVTGIEARFWVCGQADDTTMNEGQMSVVSGGIASNFIGDGNFRVIVSSGLVSNASLRGESVAPGGYRLGYISLANSGVVKDVEINKWGGVHVSSGGSAFDVTANLNGRIRISGGGYAENANVNSGGKIMVLGEEDESAAYGYPEALRGRAKDVTVYKGGSAIISGGEVSNLLVSSGGTAIVCGVDDIAAVDVFGSIHNGEIKSGGSLSIGQGAELWGFAVFGGTVTVTGWADVYGELNFDLSERTAEDDYIIDDITGLYLNDMSYCTVTVSADQADGTYKLAGNAASFNETISVEGEALTVDGNSVLIDGRYYTLSVTDSILTLTVGDTPVITGDQVQVYSSGTLVKQGTVLTGETIVSGANNSMFVYDGGTANNTFVLSSGLMCVSKGGTANYTTVSSTGAAYQGMNVNRNRGLHVYDGGAVNYTAVGSNGSVFISSGGVANQTSISGRYGCLKVSNGGKAFETTVTRNGFISVEKGGFLDNTSVAEYASLAVYQGGTATGVKRLENSYLSVYVDKNTLVTGESAGSGFEVKNGLYADQALSQWTHMYICEGGTARNVTGNSFSYLHISSGGRADNINAVKSSYFGVFAGGTATNVTLDRQVRLQMGLGVGTYMQGTSGGADIEVKNGSAFGLVINSFGYVQVFDGGIANAINLTEGQAIMYVSQGGIASNTTVADGAKIYISAGARHRGTMALADGAIVSVKAGGIIDFTVFERSTADDYMINDLSLISGAPVYTITVSADQAAGIYKLAGGAENFTGSISVGNGTADYGSVSLNGEQLVYSGNIYSLVRESGNLHFVIEAADKEAPELVITGNAAEWTNKDVVLQVECDDPEAVVSCRTGNGDWRSCTGTLTVDANCSIEFRAVDKAGNTTTERVVVDRIDKEAPAAPEVAAVSSDKNGTVIDWSDVTDEGGAGVKGYLFRYGTSENLTGEGRAVSDSRIELEDLSAGVWYCQIAGVDNAGNVSQWSTVRSFSVLPGAPENLTGTPDRLSWDAVPGASGYVVEYSKDDFDSAVSVETAVNFLDTFALPEAAFKWRVRALEGVDWSYGGEVTGKADPGPEKLLSDSDGITDLFFANAAGTWGNVYAAQHFGAGQWQGTGERVFLAGKNKLTDIFKGSTDANVLVMTDDSCGDALFLDDVYSALGNSARLAEIDEIRAGAGDDIVDMTSQRYSYSGEKIRIYGGDGNDTLWGGAESNILFGDSGNDHLTGGSGDDLIVGGAGDDVMHGGGGKDIFTFGGSWGCDVVEQLEDGSVTLWFENSISGEWNAETLTWSDGVNSVRVIGTRNISFQFSASPELSEAGAFDSSVTRNVWEKSVEGVIA